MNPSRRLDWLREELEQLERQQLRRYLAVRESAQAPLTTVDHRRLINFSSNDYLGLASDPRLLTAWRQLTADSGWGSGASPLVTGRSHWHAKLERALADFEQTDAALLFTSGYAANVGTIAALMGPDDVIFSDAKNHASIIDGCRLSRAEVRIYAHCDMVDLRKQLNAGPAGRRRLIVTDSLFSMDGDIAPLPQIADLADEHDCMLMVDEAHATGVFGATGRGVAESLAVEDRVDIRVGTLSKALGSHGGFVAGIETLIHWLANRARAYVFSTAAPDPLAVVGCEALQLIRSEPFRRELLLQRAAWLREQLTTHGWCIGNTVSQIVPIIVGDPWNTLRLATSLRERGILVPAIRPPSVPENESLLRVSVTYSHDDKMINDLVVSLNESRQELAADGIVIPNHTSAVL